VTKLVIIKIIASSQRASELNCTSEHQYSSLYESVRGVAYESDDLFSGRA